MPIGQRFYSDNPGNVSAVVVAPGPAVLYDVSGVNRSAVTRYLQVHNKTAPLAPGDVPIYSYPCPTDNVVAFSPPGVGADGRSFDIGITIAWSAAGPLYSVPAGSPGSIWAAGRRLT